MGLMAGFKEEREIKMPRTVFNLCDCNHRILLTAAQPPSMSRLWNMFGTSPSLLLLQGLIHSAV